MLPLSSLSFSILLSLGVVNAGAIRRRAPADQFTFSQKVPVSSLNFAQDGLSVSTGTTDQSLQIDASVAAGGPGLTNGARELPLDWELDLSGVKFDLTQDWVGIYYKDFNVSVPLTIDCTPNDKGWCGHTSEFFSAAGNVDKVPALDIHIPLAYRVLVRSSERVSFTQSFQVSVQKAALLVPVEHNGGGSSGQPVLVGFDKSSITLAPFDSIQVIKNMEAEIALWPGLKFTHTENIPNTTLNTTFALAPTLPKIHLAVNSFDRATSDCQEVSKSTKSKPNALVFSNVTSVVQNSEIDLSSVFAIKADGNLLPGTTVVTKPEQKGCLQLVDRKLVPPVNSDKPGDDSPGAASRLIIGSFSVVASALFALFV